MKVLKKTKTHILRSVTFFSDRSVYEIMWKKYCRATDGIMAHAHCIPNN